MPKDSENPESEKKEASSSKAAVPTHAGNAPPGGTDEGTEETPMTVAHGTKRQGDPRKRQLARSVSQLPALSAKGPPPIPPAIPSPTQLTPFPPRGQRPGDPRRLRSLFWSAAVFVGLPTILAIMYFGLFASDQYAARADFIIKTRSTTQAAGGGLLGGMTAVNPLTIIDMLVVKEYVESAQVLKDIAPVIDVRKIYSTHNADGWARLKEKPDFRRLFTGKVWTEGLYVPVSEEELLKYWNKMVVVNFDMTTGISSLEVRTFAARDSVELAKAVLGLSEALVNRLSERSQSDSLAFARKEVKEAHERAVKSLDELQAFQQTAKQLDPKGYAEARSTIQGDLEASLSEYLAQLNTLRKDLPEDAPGIQQLKNRIGGLQEQLLLQRLEATTSPSKGSAAEVLNEFSKRKLDSDFSTQAYMSALTSLENARRDAAQQSRYLEAFVLPQTPQDAEYPKRLQSIAIVFFGAAVIWAIAGLLIAAAKEHL